MIRIREVRLIDENGQQVGVVATDEALTRAKAAGLDLVEVSPRARPPVCKIMDFGKYKYEQRKKEQQQKKKQTGGGMKELRVRPKTSAHDLEVKLRKAREFLLEGDKVVIHVMFRGRERSHTELGRTVLDRVVQELAPLSRVEREPVMDGRRMSLMLLPKPRTKGQKGTEAVPAATPPPPPGPGVVLPGAAARSATVSIPPGGAPDA